MAAERQTKTTEAEINAALKLGLERRIIAEALKLVPELGDDITQLKTVLKNLERK